MELIFEQFGRELTNMLLNFPQISQNCWYLLILPYFLEIYYYLQSIDRIIPEFTTWHDVNYVESNSLCQSGYQCVIDDMLCSRNRNLYVCLYMYIYIHNIRSYIYIKFKDFKNWIKEVFQKCDIYTEFSITVGHKYLPLTHKP